LGFQANTYKWIKLTMWLPCSVEIARVNRQDRRAFTLIEVILGSVLLSTLVVTGVHGLRLHQQQLRINEHRIEAVPVAERLLTLWSSKPEGIPVGARGIVDAQRQWLWQTQLIRMQSVFGQQVLVVRFEIIENLPTPGVVLVSIDFVKPAPVIAPPSLGPENSGPTSEPEQAQPAMNESSP
jgi:hypothetical protein